MFYSGPYMWRDLNSWLVAHTHTEERLWRERAKVIIVGKEEGAQPRKYRKGFWLGRRRKEGTFINRCMKADPRALKLESLETESYNAEKLLRISPLFYFLLFSSPCFIFIFFISFLSFSPSFFSFFLPSFLSASTACISYQQGSSRSVTRFRPCKGRGCCPRPYT